MTGKRNLSPRTGAQSSRERVLQTPTGEGGREFHPQTTGDAGELHQHEEVPTSTVLRRYTFKIYPKANQETALREQCRMTADLWNALKQLCEETYKYRRELRDGTYYSKRTPAERHVPSRPWSEERKAAARAKRGVSSDGPKKPPVERLTLSFQDLTGEITALRHACPKWEAVSVFSAHRVADSLSKAFAAFYGRLAKGEKQAGYPKWKSRERSFSIPFGKSGWKLLPAGCERSDAAERYATARSWSLSVIGVDGKIRVRGELPSAPIDWKTADIMFRDGAWWISVCVEMQRRDIAVLDEARTPATVRFDLVDEFARVERAEGPRRPRDGSARVPTQSPKALHDLEGAQENSVCAEMDRRGGRVVGLVVDVDQENPVCAEMDRRADALSPPESYVCAERDGRGLGGVCRIHADNPACAERDRRDGLLLKGPDEPVRASRDGRVLAAGDVDAFHPRDCAEENERGAEGNGRRVGNGREKVVAEMDGRGQSCSCLDGRANWGQWTRRAANLCERADEVKAARDIRFPWNPGKRPSWRSRRETERAARLTGKAARIRREALHLWTTILVRSCSDLTVVTPNVADMTASPRGDEKEWGASVETVSKLNRNTLNQAPALAVAMLAYKAAEFGIRCDITKTDDVAIAVGPALVAAGKIVRRMKRVTREESTHATA